MSVQQRWPLYFYGGRNGDSSPGRYIRAKTAQYCTLLLFHKNNLKIIRYPNAPLLSAVSIIYQVTQDSKTVSVRQTILAAPFENTIFKKKW